MELKIIGANRLRFTYNKLIDNEIYGGKDMMNGIPIGKQFIALSNLSSKKVRCRREDGGTVFVYGPKRRRYGWRYTEENFLSMYTPETSKKNETEQWHSRLKRAIKCMHFSGLWPEIKQQFENELKMTWEDRKEMCDIYWDRRTWVGGKPMFKTPEEMDALWQPFYDKYPFAFTKDIYGHLQVNTGYLFEVSKCTLKSMYFGKGLNDDIKAELKYAIEDRRPWSQDRIRTSYDVSVKYDPGEQKAWYSEEYKNCGNGHYYLMLDHSTALFLEND